MLVKPGFNGIGGDFGLFTVVSRAGLEPGSCLTANTSSSMSLVDLDCILLRVLG